MGHVLSVESLDYLIEVVLQHFPIINKDFIDSTFQAEHKMRLEIVASIPRCMLKLTDVTNRCCLYAFLVFQSAFAHFILMIVFLSNFSDIDD